MFYQSSLLATKLSTSQQHQQLPTRGGDHKVPQVLHGFRGVIAEDGLAAGGPQEVSCPDGCHESSCSHVPSIIEPLLSHDCYDHIPCPELKSRSRHFRSFHGDDPPTFRGTWLLETARRTWGSRTVFPTWTSSCCWKTSADGQIRACLPNKCSAVLHKANILVPRPTNNPSPLSGRSKTWKGYISH